MLQDVGTKDILQLELSEKTDMMLYLMMTTSHKLDLKATEQLDMAAFGHDRGGAPPLRKVLPADVDVEQELPSQFPFLTL